MRIAHVTPAGLHPYSGVLAVIRELAVSLAARGHDVELWQLSRWRDGATPGFEESLAAAGVELIRTPVRSNFVLGPLVREAISERAPDVVHLHNCFSPPNNLIAARVRQPYVVTAHGGYAPEQLAFHHWRKAVFRVLLEKRMLERASFVVGLTAAERDEIHAFASRSRTTVVPNGVRPPPPVDPVAFRRRIGIGGEPLVVFAGKMDHYHKRVGDLVDGVAATPGWHLALVGPDWRAGRARIERQVSQLDAWERVHLVPPLRGTELHEAYAAADVFALLSRWEGFSVALLEALSHGTPAVVSPEVERRLRIVAEGAGWLAPNGIAPVLAELGTLEEAGWERRHVAARALAARYDWDDVAAGYEDVYQGAVRAVGSTD